MHALVFAAGRGTRLQPLTDETPKPLLTIGAADTSADSPPAALPKHVMTVNGDNVFDDCDLSRLVDRHHDAEIDGTVLLDRFDRNDARSAARCTRTADGLIRSVETTTGSASGSLAAGVQTHPGPALFETCRTIDRAATGEYELTDAFDRLLAEGYRYAGIELGGWHLNVNTPADLSTARARFRESD